MGFRTKKIYLNTKKTNYCQVRLYSTKKEMNGYYFSYNKRYGKEHEDVLGASLHYTFYKNGKLSQQTGTVILSIENCGAEVVTHELLHAVLYAWKMSINKKQYPIVIRSMRQEEELLHNHSSAVNQFYNWYWKMVIKFKKQKTQTKKNG